MASKVSQEKKEFDRVVAEGVLEYENGYLESVGLVERLVGIYFVVFPQGRESVGYPEPVRMVVGGGSGAGTSSKVK